MSGFMEILALSLEECRSISTLGLALAQYGTLPPELE
jgi:hypothetical protein